MIPKAFMYKGWMYGLHTKKVTWPQMFERAMQRLVTIKPKAEVWAAARSVFLGDPGRCFTHTGPIRFAIMCL